MMYDRIMKKHARKLTTAEEVISGTLNDPRFRALATQVSEAELKLVEENLRGYIKTFVDDGLLSMFELFSDEKVVAATREAMTKMHSGVVIANEEDKDSNGTEGQDK